MIHDRADLQFDNGVSCWPASLPGVSPLEMLQRGMYSRKGGHYNRTDQVDFNLGKARLFVFVEIIICWNAVMCDNLLALCGNENGCKCRD